MLIYKKTLDESQEVVKLLKKYRIISSPKGRLAKYIKIASKIDDSWTEKEKGKFSKKYTNGEVIFALKELIELKDILKDSLSIYTVLSDESKKALATKIKYVLSGPEYPMNENNKNSSARNYQFELRLASRLIKAGYTNIGFGENPDISITIENRIYAFECKRVFGASERAIVSNTLSAIQQLKDNNKGKYFAGIVALDISPQYEKGQNWLASTSEMAVDNYISKELEKHLLQLHQRINKLEKAAEEGIIVALILNLSAVYVINFTERFGALEENTVLVFNKENPRAAIFDRDFDSFKAFKEN